MKSTAESGDLLRTVQERSEGQQIRQARYSHTSSGVCPSIWQQKADPKTIIPSTTTNERSCLYVGIASKYRARVALCRTHSM